MVRLDKFLADAGIGTRSEVKKQLKSGIVELNGEICKSPEMKIDPQKDKILISGKEVQYETMLYYLFYKPTGCVTARTDERHQTVMDFFPENIRRKCSPVGRLDKDTEGLLLITNDGALNHHLMSPTHHVAKTYYAQLDHEIPREAIRLFREGVDIGDSKKTWPAELIILPDECDRQGNVCHSATLTIHEGRFHQVKRMFSSIGCNVTYLKRLAVGSLTLGELKPGEFRPLTCEEIDALRK